MTRREPHGLVFMLRREDGRYAVGCSCGWQHPESVASFFMVCELHAKHATSARAAEPRACATGCGLAAVPGDRYCAGCASAADRSAWATS